MSTAFVSLMVFLGILLYCIIGVAHYWLYNFIYYKCKHVSKRQDFSYWYKYNGEKEFCGVISSIWFLTDIIAPFSFIIAGIVIIFNKLFKKLLRVA